MLAPPIGGLLVERMAFLSVATTSIRRWLSSFVCTDAGTRVQEGLKSGSSPIFPHWDSGCWTWSWTRAAWTRRVQQNFKQRQQASKLKTILQSKPDARKWEMCLGKVWSKSDERCQIDKLADLKYSLFFFWLVMFGSTNIKAFRVGDEEYEDSDLDLDSRLAGLDYITVRLLVHRKVSR